MEKYLKVGKILKAQGLNGEVRVFSTTSFKDIRYKKGNKLFINKNGEMIEFVVSSFYSKGENLDVISFKNFDSIEKISPFIGCEIFAIKDNKILFENEFFYDDLIGLNVYDEDDNKIGLVASIEEFPSQITLKISLSNKKFAFIPFNDFFIKSVDLDNKKMTIHLIEGLIEWNLLY